MKIEFTLPQASLKIASRGQEVRLDMARLSPAMWQNLFAYGVSQKIGDAASAASTIAGEDHFGKARADVPKADWTAWMTSPAGEKAVGDQTLAMMLKACDALYRDEWNMRVGTGTSRAAQDPATKMAHDLAKAVLLPKFKAATGKAKIADIRQHAKIAPFFTDKDRWDEDTVAAWIVAQAKAGKADYRAQAEEMLASVADAASELDLDF
jgi:hypothetical protein